MRYSLILLLICLVFTANAQRKKSPSKKAEPVANQGICGTVIEKKGNFMPRVDSPGPYKQTPKGQPVVREVVIYPVLSMDQVKTDDEGFITEVPGAKPVRTVKTDKQGKFCAYRLPAGQYSVLVREPKGLYGNVFDANNRINVETVQPGKVTKTTFEITHQAAF